MGQCFVEIDLVHAEWVVTAFLANDQNMLNVVYSGVDPHVRTGALISGTSEEVVILEHEAVGHLADPVEIDKIRRAISLGGVPITKMAGIFLPRSMSIRQCGKKSNHGLDYGMQYGKFALINEIEEAESKRIVSLYRDKAYPGLKQYYLIIEEELRKNGRRLTNCFGQSRRFLDEWGQDLLNAAYAFKPQSTVANITNNGWQAIYGDKRLRRVDPVAQVHDSCLTCNKFDNFPELAEQILVSEEHLATPFSYNGYTFTLKREVKVGFSWGELCMIPVRLDLAGLAAGLEKALEESLAAKSSRLPRNLS